MVAPPFAYSSWMTGVRFAVVTGLSLLVGWWTASHLQELATTSLLPGFLAMPFRYHPDSPILLTVCGILAGCLSFFLFGCVIPALADGGRTVWIARRLRAASEAGQFGWASGHPVEFSWGFYPLFDRLWRQFASTVHRQSRSGHWPGEERFSYFATAPLDNFFNVTLLVDAPMRVEFFRHLPGILTGVGIVGTFAGILLGLTEFNPSVPPEQIGTQLDQLFTGVSTAFVASFFAIVAAILVTTGEKWLLHWRYAQVEFLQNFLNTLFIPVTQRPPDPVPVVEPAPVVDPEAQFQRMAQLLAQTVAAESERWSAAMQTHITPHITRSMEATAERFAHVEHAMREGLLEPLRVIAQSTRLAVLQQQEFQERLQSLESAVRDSGVMLGTRLEQERGTVVELLTAIHETLDGHLTGQQVVQQEQGNRVVQAMNAVEAAVDTIGALLRQSTHNAPPPSTPDLTQALEHMQQDLQQDLQQVAALAGPLDTLRHQLAVSQEQMLATLHAWITDMVQGNRQEQDELRAMIQTLVPASIEHVLTQTRPESPAPPVVPTVVVDQSGIQQEIAAIRDLMIRRTEQIEACITAEAARWQEVTLATVTASLNRQQPVPPPEPEPVLPVLVQQLEQFRNSLTTRFGQELDRQLEAHLARSRQLAADEQASGQASLRADLGQLATELQQIGEREQQEVHTLVQRIGDFIAQSEARHDRLLTSLDQFNHNLTGDLAWVRESLMSKSEETALHLSNRMGDLDQQHQGTRVVLERLEGNLADEMQRVEREILEHHTEAEVNLLHRLEEMVQNTAQEQTRFIELLGERLEALRQRMKIK
jgi:hypothetical protein